MATRAENEVIVGCRHVAVAVGGCLEVSQLLQARDTWAASRCRLAEAGIYLAGAGVGGGSNYAEQLSASI